MFIQTEATDDPAVLKFTPDRPVLGQGTMEIRSRGEATRSPLAVKLFEVYGVAALSFGPDSITVTKWSGEWQTLKPVLLGAIMEHLVSGAPIVCDDRRSGDRAPEGGGDPILEKIRDALRRVIDPELGYNIVDLGLIYEVSMGEGGMATVTMTTTTPGCPATGYLVAGARECAASVEGVEMAEVTLTHEPRWSPALMSDMAKAHFGIADGGG